MRTCTGEGYKKSIEPGNSYNACKSEVNRPPPNNQLPWCRQGYDVTYREVTEAIRLEVNTLSTSSSSETNEESGTRERLLAEEAVQEYEIPHTTHLMEEYLEIEREEDEMLLESADGSMKVNIAQSNDDVADPSVEASDTVSVDVAPITESYQEDTNEAFEEKQDDITAVQEYDGYEESSENDIDRYTEDKADNDSSEDIVTQSLVYSTSSEF